MQLGLVRDISTDTCFVEPVLDSVETGNKIFSEIPLGIGRVGS